MTSVLLAANVADGHVAPMLGVAEHFARIRSSGAVPRR